MKSIQGIVFDWGGVIIDEPSAALQQYCCRRLEIPLAIGGAQIWKHLPKYQDGRIQERQLWELVCEGSGKDVSVIPVRSLWADALRAVFQFRKDVLDVIEQLKQRGYTVGFLSNTEPAAAAYFHELRMDALFAASVLSCEVGLLKPDVAIYQLVAEAMGLPAAALLLLDDREENIEGAKNAGMAAVRVATTREIRTVLQPYLEGAMSPDVV